MSGWAAVRSGGLPIAATCFNTLELVAYPSKQVLEEKLLLAMWEPASPISSQT